MFTKAFVALLALGAQQVLAHPFDADFDIEGRSADHGVIDYGDETGKAWGGLCANGTQQSPIDIESKNIRKWPAMHVHFNWPVGGATIKNHGPAIYIEKFAKPGSVVLANNEYELKQFHFHTPSEHWIDGVGGEMEVHFVHLNPKGHAAVIGAIIDVADGTTKRANPAIEAALAKATSVPKKDMTSDTRGINLEDLGKVLGSAPFRTYTGSLTTHPCTEGVKWFVSEKRLYATQDTINAAKGVMGMNARWPTNRDTKPKFI
ncbi:Carbonic anhydrase, alpha-class, catalytic domain protein [Moelleriella libera RCEF 2490]|uniref:carbonic anhydrase n=1 Tax=Moelleriella libera RCEF 2490 TaxID=1081109 RepID=A0A167ZEK5_9HYPO|nr:Carbonic anhydrase, alpha-class, catalytic domain protein [Moelleriella libera RCEF 2490]